jgi:formylglycine-generating enzyme required for sulfatase activity
MDICPHCGGTHPSQARFCPTTGKPLTTSEEITKAQPEQPTPTSPEEISTQPAQKKHSHNEPTWLILGLILGVLSVIAGIAMLIYPYLQVTRGGAIATQFTRYEEITPAIKSTFVNASVVETENRSLAPTLTQTVLSDSISVKTQEPILEATSTLQPTFIETITPEPTTISLITKLNKKDQAAMIYVAAGSFAMGSDASIDPYFWGAESPIHTVTLDGYWIYQTEVTNAMYQACVAEKACPRPRWNYSSTYESYYGNPDFDNFPVIYVSWVSAVSYCTWGGGRLPSEAEWEKAARGSQDKRLFPWGDTPANAKQANFCDVGCSENYAESDKNDGYTDAAPVGNYPAGASPYGVLDMAGNVWEWTYDWFATPYNTSITENPYGPANGTARVIRGGSYYNPSSGIRVVQRLSIAPDKSLETLGFRCVVEDK